MIRAPENITTAATAAARAAFERALQIGYGPVAAQQFARLARREASESESPAAIALRIVRPRAPREPHAPTPPGAAS